MIKGSQSKVKSVAWELHSGIANAKLLTNPRFVSSAFWLGCGSVVLDLKLKKLYEVAKWS